MAQFVSTEMLMNCLKMCSPDSTNMFAFHFVLEKRIQQNEIHLYYSLKVKKGIKQMLFQCCMCTSNAAEYCRFDFWLGQATLKSENQKLLALLYAVIIWYNVFEWVNISSWVVFFFSISQIQTTLSEHVVLVLIRHHHHLIKKPNFFWL